MTASAASILLALVSAMLFGISSILSKRGLANVDPQTGAMISIGTTTLAFALSAPLWMRAEYWGSAGFWIFVLNGLFHPFLSMNFAMQALRRAGPTVASTLSATSPLFAGATAVLFLGERLTPLIIVGTFCTVAGAGLLAWSPGGFRGAMRAALLFATGAAMVRGLNHSLGSYGLDLMPNAFMAGFVSFGTSWLMALGLHRYRTGSFPRSAPMAGARWFILTGAMIAVAIACMYSALGIGDVTIVSPIIALYPFFTMLTALASGSERITRKIALGVGLVVGGIALLGWGAG